MEQPVSILDYKNDNYEELNKIFCEVNWMDILSSNDLDNSGSTFYEIVNNGVVANVPKYSSVFLNNKSANDSSRISNVIASLFK